MDRRSSVKIKRPHTPADFASYYETRWYTLRRPWHQRRGSERDELEKEAVHVMAVDGRKVVGVARLHFNGPGVAQFRYMGVDSRCRHRGIATRLLRALEKEAKKRGARVAWFNAREPAVPFYEKRGYAIFDISYTLYGCIPHWKMMKEL
jgi:GNAT superfamily N-acetyltransferase